MVILKTNNLQMCARPPLFYGIVLCKQDVQSMENIIKVLYGRGVFAFGEDFRFAQMRTPFPKGKVFFTPTTHTIKTNTLHKGRCSFLWRRQRDSNPRGFWPNGFQDRLVVTASIFLHI